MVHNHAGYEKRLAFIRDLFHDQFNIENVEIEPIAYDADCPFKYNNFVYRVSVTEPLTITPKHGQRQPATTAPPEDARNFILRLTNSEAEGMSPETRVQNEVAIISLAAAALGGFEPKIVPSVYGWGTATSPSTQGWILQKIMPGSPVDEAFDGMPLEEQKVVLGQMANILHALQSFRLPCSITKYGGVTFDEHGDIVSAAMTSVGSGPWSTYQECFEDKLRRALQKADDNPYIKGWYENGIRQRLEAFLDRGIEAQFASLEEVHDKAIVHADFSLDNMLYDPQTNRITALLDYDFACILHPSYEFFRSFDGAGGQFQGWSDIQSREQTALRDSKLHGFPSPLPATTTDGVNWEVAKAWEDELERLDAERPRTLKGIEKIADVDELLRSILPWRVTNSDVLRMQTEAGVMRCRDENEAQLIKLLDHLGF